MKPAKRLARGWANGYRTFWGVFFIGALFNAAITLPNSTSLLRRFSELSAPGIDWIAREFMIPVAPILIGLVVMFEAAVGVLVLLRDPWARRGLFLAIAWMVLLVPFLSMYGIVNAILALSMLPLLARTYDNSLGDIVTRMR